MWNEEERKEQEERSNVGILKDIKTWQGTDKEKEGGGKENDDTDNDNEGK